MADKALTDLPDGGAATNGDVIYVVRDGNSRKAAFPTLADVATTGDYGDLDNTPPLGGAAALDVGTSAGTVAAGDDSRITGAVQKAGTGQVLTGQYGHTPHNYGNLSSGNITLNPANGMTGTITRNNTSNAIVAPAGTPTTVYNMIIFIDGTSSSGSPSLSGFDNSDFGDDMPGNNQHAWLYVTVGPSAKTAKIEAIDY